MLAWTIYVSFIGALLARPSVEGAGAAGGAGNGGGESGHWAGCVPSLAARRVADGDAGGVDSAAWNFVSPGGGWDQPDAGAADGVAATAGILFSWNIEKRTQEFFAFYLVLIGGYRSFSQLRFVSALRVLRDCDYPEVFSDCDLGFCPRGATSENAGSLREYAAMKLALYSFAGSALVLAGMVAAWVASGGHSMGFEALAAFPFSAHFQMAIFPLVFVEFAVLAGMWPFHTWAPTGHAAAPTAASMLLAGVVMKLGADGCLRVAMMLFPGGLDPWGFHVLGLGSWRDVFALLALIGIVYGASVALVQRDFKFVIGYSSVCIWGLCCWG